MEGKPWHGNCQLVFHPLTLSMTVVQLVHEVADLGNGDIPFHVSFFVGLQKPDVILPNY